MVFCIVLGVAIGRFLPQIPNFLNCFEHAQVSIPIAILIWLMIFPMILKNGFTSIVNSTKQPKGLATLVINWLIKPFTVYAIALFFLKVTFKNFIISDLATEYLVGAILLGAAPCTSCYKLSCNFGCLHTYFALLLGVSNVLVSYDTLFLS